MTLYAAGSCRDLSVDADVLCGLTWTGQLLWYADAGRERIAAVDPHSGQHLDTIECPGLRGGLATSGGYLIYVAGTDHRLCVVDPATGVLVRQVRNPRPPAAILALEGGRHGLWIGYPDRLDLRRGDGLAGTEPASTTGMALVSCLAVAGTVTGVTVTDRYLVYCTYPDRAMRVPLGIVTVIAPTTGQEVLSINVHGTPTGLAWDGSRIWYCDNYSVQLRAIDVPGIVR